MSDMNYDHQKTNPSNLPSQLNNTSITGDDNINNQPPPGDTTSEGGYGGDPFTRRAQRGLVDQSLNGGPIGSELQDAKQGVDGGSREEYAREQQWHGHTGRSQPNSQPTAQNQNQGQSLNPYGQQSLENREEAGEKLASKYSDMRGRQYESGGMGGNDQDVGA